MIVDELARRAQVRPHLVRYYARIGLLKPARHPQNGYKLFTDADVKRVRFVLQARMLGYRLSEIASILQDAGQGKSPCPRVREISRRRIRENRRKLDDLLALQRRMEEAPLR